MPSKEKARLHLAIPSTDTRSGLTSWTYYKVSFLPSDPSIGAPAWRLEKSSEGEGAASYEVIKRPHGPECNCASATYRENQPCKHIIALRDVGLIRDRD